MSVGLEVAEPYELQEVKGERQCVYCIVHFLFRRASNSTNVWFAVCDKLYESPYLDEWENISNHDSCWRDAVRTSMSRLYFKMCNVVNSEVAPNVLETRTIRFNVKKAEILGFQPDPNTDNSDQRIFESVKIVKTSES